MVTVAQTPTAPARSTSLPRPVRKARKRADGEGSLYYDGKAGLWRGELMIGRRPDGRRDVRKVSAKTQADCRARLDALKSDRAKGVTLEPHRITVAELLRLWDEDCVTRSLRPKTLHSYRQVVRLYLVPLLGTTKVRDLRPEHVRHLLTSLIERGLSAATVRYTRVILHGALELAVRQEFVARNVADAVRAPKRKRPELHPPTPEQSGQLIDAATASGDRLAPLWTVAIYAGCRPGELLALKWDDIDWERGKIHVRRNLTKVNGKAPTLADPKSDRGRRTLTLDDEAMTALRSQRSRQNEERLLLGPDYTDYGLVFCSHTGTPLIQRNVTRAFKRTLVRAGLPATVRMYDLRHANATAMLLAGVHPKSASERLGHSGTALFMDTYTHMLEELDADAAARLGQAIRGPRRAG